MCLVSKLVTWSTCCRSSLRLSCLLLALLVFNKISSLVFTCFELRPGSSAGDGGGDGERLRENNDNNNNNNDSDNDNDNDNNNNFIHSYIYRSVKCKYIKKESVLYESGD